MSNILDKIASIQKDFKQLPLSNRLELLLEYSNLLGSTPKELRDIAINDMEKVHECQTPVFIKAEYNRDNGFLLNVIAPKEAPTTRGFAAIIVEITKKESLKEVSNLPPDIAYRIGLNEIISPLRLNGMHGLSIRTMLQAKKMLEENEFE